LRKTHDENISMKTVSSNSQTDWERVDSLKDKDIDLSDCPEVTPEMFAKAVVRCGLKPIESKKQVTLCLDADRFKAQGPGYQTRINELLREFMKANQS